MSLTKLISIQFLIVSFCFLVLEVFSDQQLTQEIDVVTTAAPTDIYIENTFGTNCRNATLANCRRYNRQRKTFSKWSRWSKCNSECIQRRYRRCLIRANCGNGKLIKERQCSPTKCNLEGKTKQSMIVHLSFQQPRIPSREQSYGNLFDFFRIPNFDDDFDDDDISEEYEDEEENNESEDSQMFNNRMLTFLTNLFRNEQSASTSKPTTITTTTPRPLFRPRSTTRPSARPPTTSLPTKPIDETTIASKPRFLQSDDSNKNDIESSEEATSPPCGMKPSSVEAMLRIMGGRNAKKGDWPWQVVLLNTFKQNFCGGTLIAPQWVITAAHCISFRTIYVRTGEYKLSVREGVENDYRVIKVLKHPSFNDETVDNDIALLKLSKPVQPSLHARFACLPKPRQDIPEVGTPCKILGWGEFNNVLQEGEISIASLRSCRIRYFWEAIPLSNNMFCAGSTGGRVDTCKGDSGGPLLCKDDSLDSKPWTVFGITSFGAECGTSNNPGIYTKVSHYTAWIEKVMACNGDCE